MAVILYTCWEMSNLSSGYYMNYNEYYLNTLNEYPPSTFMRFLEAKKNCVSLSTFPLSRAAEQLRIGATHLQLVLLLIWFRSWLERCTHKMRFPLGWWKIGGKVDRYNKGLWFYLFIASGRMQENS